MNKNLFLIYGGLGNQLFQYAFSQFLINKYKNITSFEYIDFTNFSSTKRNWELGFLDLKPSKISSKDIFYIRLKRKIYQTFLQKKLGKFNLGIISESNHDQTNLFIKNSMIVDGYWQSLFFFEEFQNIIRKNINKKFEKIFKKELGIKKSENRVSVHVRLGDYINDPKIKNVHLVCDINWYKSAMDYLRKVNSNFVFEIFSDDYPTIKKYFTEDDVLINKPIANSPTFYDLYSMSLNDHFIISNSSYSWWASFLGEKNYSKVLVPKYWEKNLKTINSTQYRKNMIII